jgi:hypothetical protein
VLATLSHSLDVYCALGPLLNYIQIYARQMADTIACNACNYNVTAEDRNNHYKSDWHRYNVKRQCAGLGPIARDIFEEKLSGILINIVDMIASSPHLCVVTRINT